MPAVSDILMIQLGIDASGLERGQQQAERAIEGTKRSLEQQGNALEKVAKDIGGGIETLIKGVAGFFGLVLSFEGFRQLVVDAAAAGTAMGRFAESIDSTVERTQLYGQAFRATAGSDSTILQTLQVMKHDLVSVSQGLTEWTPWMKRFGQLTGKSPIGLEPEQIIQEESAAFERRGITPAQARQFLPGLPLSEGDVVILTQHQKLLEALEKQRKEIGTPTTPQTKAMEQLNEDIANVRTAAELLALQAVTLGEPLLHELLTFTQHALTWLRGIAKMLGMKIEESEVQVPVSTGSQPRIQSRVRPGTSTSVPSFPQAPPATRTPSPQSLLRQAPEVEATAAEEWRKAGMSEAGVAGVMANIREESGFNPNLRHPDQPNWSGEAHFAHGLYQEGGQEWLNYEAWLKRTHPGADWQDAKLQSEFAAWNLKTNYPKVWARMVGAQSREEAAAVYTSGYLKPAKPYETSRINKFYREGVPPAPRAETSSEGAGPKAVAPGQAGAVSLHQQGAPAAAVDDALKLEGLHERRDRATLIEYLRTGGAGMDPAKTSWCAAFVNSSLQREGVKGSGSAVATSFLRWGMPAVGGVQKGDVLVEARGHRAGETGGHVGFATGESRIGPSGLEYQMIAGNTRDEVLKYWISAGRVTPRRALPDVSTGAAAAAQHSETMRPRVENTEMSAHVNQIIVNTQSTDPVGIAHDIRDRIGQELTLSPGN